MLIILLIIDPSKTPGDSFHLFLPLVDKITWYLLWVEHDRYPVVLGSHTTVIKIKKNK